MTAQNYAGYVDLAMKPTSGLLVDAAGRFERYSDFRSKTIGKTHRSLRLRTGICTARHRQYGPSRADAR